MKHTAVIFDLFGTLVDNCRNSYSEELLQAGVLAELADGREDEFLEIWRSDEFYRMRTLGRIGDANECIRYVCGRLGVEGDAAAIASAERMRLDHCRRELTPRPDAAAALGRLRRRGLRLGLLSVCAYETPRLWPDTPLAPLFDAAVFSCEVGMVKPDPRLYRLVCEQLGADPRECLFVGDGAANELTGARGVGMDAVLICAPHEEDLVMQREDPKNWTGPRVSSLSELAEMAEGAA